MFSKDNAGKIKELNVELPPLEQQLKESTTDYNVSKKQLEEARTVQNKFDGDKKRQETLLLGFQKKLAATQTDHGLSELMHKLGQECNDPEGCDKMRIAKLKEIMTFKMKEVEDIKNNKEITEEQRKELLENADFDNFKMAYDSIISNYEKMK